MNRILTLIVLIFFLSFFISCDNENEDMFPKNEKYELNFLLTNNGNQPLPLIWMEGNVVFPVEKNMHGLIGNCFDMQVGQSKTISFDGQDSVPLVYDGCRKWLVIQVNERIGRSLYHSTTWKTKMDTVRGKENIDVNFSWPEDTLGAEKIRSEYKTTLWDEEIRF